MSNQVSPPLDINMTPDVSMATVWEALKVNLRGQVILFMAIKKWTQNQNEWSWKNK